MSSIAALPPPSAATGSTSLVTLRKMLASDALPVTPVRPIPENERRRQQPEVDATDDATQGARGTGLANTRARSAGDDGERSRRDDRDGPVTATPQPLTGAPNAGYVAQSIHQEAMGPGLHIEPWDAAIQAYRRADAGAPAGSLVTSVSV